MTGLYLGRVLLAACTVLILSLVAHAQPDGMASPPSTVVRVAPAALRLEIGKHAEITVRVAPPAGHHAYLDAGKEGVLLPIEIDLSTVRQAGIRVRAVSAPKGKWDEQYGATVLRGEGAFRYELTALPVAKAGTTEYAIEVQSQACDDATGACYFPQTDTLPVKITVGNTAGAPNSLANDAAIDSPIREASSSGNDGAAVDFSQYAPRTSRPAHGLLVWMLLAFVAGLVLNVMPCVLPVVSIKVLSFVRQAGESRRRVLGLGLVFAAGMMTVFLALAAAAIVFGLGWGQQFQSQTFLIIMIALVFAFALSLFGVYEFGVPRAVNALASGSTREGFGAAYLKGALATVLATPCSGPFLGSTLAWTLTQPPAIVVLIFGMLGLGMAVPYVVLTAQPGLLKRLPKPGAWMETFKHIMGFFLVGTAVYLMVSLDERLLLFTMLLLVFVALGGWLWGRFSVQIASAAGRLAVLAAALLIVAAGAYLSFGTLRGMLHPPAVSSGALFAWEPFDPDRLARYHREGRGVMLDFTADWCANCTFNEVRVYNSPAMRKLLKEKNIVAMKADLTREGPETATIRRLMAQLGARSIPFLAVFPGDRPMEPYTLYDLVDKKTVSNLLKKMPDAGSHEQQ